MAKLKKTPILRYYIYVIKDKIDKKSKENGWNWLKIKKPRTKLEEAPILKDYMWSNQGWNWKK
jgi:hypothetical protein